MSKWGGVKDDWEIQKSLLQKANQKNKTMEWCSPMELGMEEGGKGKRGDPKLKKKGEPRRGARKKWGLPKD